MYFLLNKMNKNCVYTTINISILRQKILHLYQEYAFVLCQCNKLYQGNVFVRLSFIPFKSKENAFKKTNIHFYLKKRN